ncbi:MAG: hypothetical protein IT529_21825 [Burkholderiales bacterium]|nr:hypothetical protein [Burkholderiales bacterium]
MATRYFRKRSLLAKIETTYGSDASPTGAANAIQARNVQFTPKDLEYEDRDVVRAYLGHQDQIVVTGRARIAFETEAAGSGTAGVAPAWGPLLRACAFSQLALVAAHSGTAQAGAASTITLAAGASATDDAYRGMRIRTTGGTGSGQARTIATYNGTSKVATVSEAWSTAPDATTTYSIDAQVAYLPVSTGIEAATMYMNMDGKRHILLGARGSVGLRLNARSIPMFVFDFTALAGTISDTALPTDVFTAWQKPLAVNNANTSGFRLHGFAGRLYGLEVAMANQVEYRNLVGQEDVLITDRRPAGSLAIEDPTLAEKNYFSAIDAVTLGALDVLHGTAAGNQLALHAPAVQLTGPGYENRQSVVALTMATRFTASLGNDEVAVQAL